MGIISAVKAVMDAHNDMQKHLDALDHVERGGAVTITRK